MQNNRYLVLRKASIPGIMKQQNSAIDMKAALDRGN